MAPSTLPLAQLVPGKFLLRITARTGRDTQQKVVPFTVTTAAGGGTSP